jgi:Tetratricopeptide repeat
MLDDWLSYRMGARGAQLVILLVDFLEAPTWEESVLVLQTHPDLLNEELAELLYAGARGGGRQPGDGAAGDLLNTAAVLLRLCAATLDPAAALEQLRPSIGQKLTVPPADLDFLRMNAMGQLRMAAVEAQSRFLRSMARDDLDIAVRLWTELLNHSALAAVPTELRVRTYAEAASLFWLAYTATDDEGHLDVIIRCHQAAAPIMPHGSAERGDQLTGLARALYQRYDRGAKENDLDDAIAAYEEALPLLPAAGKRSDLFVEWDRAAVLHELGVALRRRFLAVGNAADLDGALWAHTEALSSTRAGTTEYARYLDATGTDLRTRYSAVTGDPKDLSQAIEALRKAAAEDCIPVRERAGFRNDLGVALRDRYELTGSHEDLDEATAIHRSLAGEGEPPDATRNDRAMFLNNLAIDLRLHYHAGEGDARDRSLCAFRAAAEAAEGSPDCPQMLMDLAVGLMDRYRSAGDIADLDEAIAAFRTAVATTQHGTQLGARAAANLGLALEMRFHQTGDRGDLNAAVSALRESAALPAPPLDRASHLGNLGVMLTEQYRQTAQSALLSEAIDALERARAALPSGAPSNAWLLGTLSQVLHARYQRAGDLDDLDQAAAVLREAIAFTDPGSQDRLFMLNDLGIVLVERPDADRASLDEAVLALEEAVQRTQRNSPYWPTRLTTLAAVLRRRHGADDLERAGEVLRQAVTATPQDSPRLALRLNQLGSLWLQLPEATGSPVTLLEAIRTLENSLAAAKPEDPELAMFLNNLAEGYRLLYQLTGAAEALANGQASFRKAVTTGLENSVERALGSAGAWGDWAADRRAWPEAAQAYLLGLEASELLVRAQLSRAHKEIRLQRSIAVRAAHAATAAGDLAAAALAFERGRAVLLSESLELSRAQLDTLTELGHGMLAARYRDAADRWLELSSEKALTPLSGTDTRLSTSPLDW